MQEIKLNYKKISKIILYSVLAISAVYICVTLPKRIITEKKNKKVEICISYDEISELCGINGYDMDEFLKRAAVIGVKSACLSEETVSSLENDGRIIFYKMSDYKRLKLLDLFPPQIQIRANTIAVRNRNLARRISAVLDSRYAIKSRKKKLGIFTVIYPDINIKHTPSFWNDFTPLGFDADKIKAIEEAGLSVVARPKNTGDIAWLKDIIPEKITTFLWWDKEIPGYPGQEKKLSDIIKDKEKYFISLEFRSLHGENILKRNATANLILGHVISSQELSNNHNDRDHIARWLRAVKERGNRFLLVHFWKEKDIEANFDYLRTLSKEIEKCGYRLDKAEDPEFPQKEAGRPRSLFIIFIAIVFPLISIYMRNTAKKYYLNYLLINANTLLGGLLISALMFNSLYMKKVLMLPYVKIAMMFPILFSVIMLYDKDSLLKFWMKKVEIRHICITLAIGAVLAVMLLRSGNYNFGYLFFEKNIRELLEKLLPVRPRTKEFLIGQPLLLAGLYFNKKYLILAGMIGQVSIINTFLHAHTPVMTSVARTFHGLWLGLFAGFLIIYTSELLLKKRKNTASK